MPLANQTVVIAGVTGVVGSGIVRQCLNANATVIAVSRSAANLDTLRSTVNIETNETFIGLIGEFATEATATDTVAAIAEA